MSWLTEYKIILEKPYEGILFHKENGGNISYAILYEHRVGDPMATKHSTGLASRHTQLIRLYLFVIKSSWVNVSKIYKLIIYAISYMITAQDLVILGF